MGQILPLKLGVAPITAPSSVRISLMQRLKRQAHRMQRQNSDTSTQPLNPSGPVNFHRTLIYGGETREHSISSFLCAKYILLHWLQEIFYKDGLWPKASKTGLAATEERSKMRSVFHLQKITSMGFLQVTLRTD